jgi:hypothetical protein
VETNLKDREYVSRSAKCDRATETAIHVVTQFGDCWIPRKCISDRSDVCERGDEGLLVVSRWLAEQPGKEALRQR